MFHLTVALLDDDALILDPRPELCVRLAVDGILPDPTGRRPPDRLELRLSSRALADLDAQIHGIRNQLLVRGRERAERALGQEQSRAAEAAVNNARVDTGTIARVAVALNEHQAPPGVVA
ncbi:hypothetical protein [Streptomyces sp. SBT349]|uniref:hypothetical protein n=1 Tax=Streptomyces sp. SBT349 TaxID=1580539 RepID=UPI00066DDCC0|nr:hypothetical protein [Streptomyces sp. SBT349]